MPAETPRRRGSLQTRLLLLFLWIGLTPLTLIGAFSHWQASNNLRDAAGHRLSALAYNVGDKIDRNLNERYADVRVFVKSSTARAMDAVALVDRVNTQVLAYAPNYKLIVVVDTEGKVVVANTVDLNGRPLDTSMLLGRDVRAEPWCGPVLSGAVAPGEALVGQVRPEPLLKALGDENDPLALAFSAPIVADGKVVGAWIDFFNWRVVQEIVDVTLQKSRQPGESRLALRLFDATGMLLVGPNPTEAFVVRHAGHPVVEQAQVRGANSFSDGPSFDPDALEDPTVKALFGWYQTVGSGDFPGLGWSVIASQDASEALAAVDAQGRNMAVAAVLTALAVLLVALATARSITAPIRSVEQQLGAVADGGADLTTRLPTDADDEVGALAEAFNRFLGSLSTLIRGLVDGAGRLSAGAGQLAAASRQTAEGAAEQTRQVLRTSSAMEEISATIGQMAQSARSTAVVATSTMNATRRGRERVADATAGLRGTDEALQRLQAHSTEISQVVAAIGDLAQQTHILSINAAIEAADTRASGARFGVVADEIGRLADRSATAAGQIGRTLNELQRGIQEAASRTTRVGEQARQVEEAFAGIALGVEQINDMVTAVSAATSEQAIAAEQVADTLGAIARVSQETEKASQETAATIASLSAVAAELSATTARFKV